MLFILSFAFFNLIFFGGNAIRGVPRTGFFEDVPRNTSVPRSFNISNFVNISKNRLSKCQKSNSS
jgi:hypothetical protein